MGSSTFDFGAGESLLITADVPTVSQITQASGGKPYLSLVIDLDRAVIEGLVVEMGSAPYAAGAPVRVEQTESEVTDAALRLLRLLDRPASRPVLEAQIIRELHFWLLSGHHGGAIRSLGVADSHAHRIARAIALIRRNFASPLRVEQLAEAAGMSPASFHEHFRAITSLTPLQFQKQLRLIEARRMMLADRRRHRQRCPSGRFRERSPVHAGIWAHVRLAAGARHEGGKGADGGGLTCAVLAMEKSALLFARGSTLASLLDGRKPSWPYGQSISAPRHTRP